MIVKPKVSKFKHFMGKVNPIGQQRKETDLDYFLETEGARTWIGDGYVALLEWLDGRISFTQYIHRIPTSEGSALLKLRKDILDIPVPRFKHRGEMGYGSKYRSKLGQAIEYIKRNPSSKQQARLQAYTSRTQPTTRTEH